MTTSCARFRASSLVRIRLPDSADEVETLTGDQDDLSAALNDIRAVLGQLGITEADLTSELYTDAVMRHRPETDS